MKVFGVISDERAYRSKSPVMHNRVLYKTDLDGVYAPFAVAPERLEDAVKGLRALKIAGANVTVPYKEKVIPFLDELSEGAAGIGAVNTIVNRGGRLIGYNTDADGFLDALDGAGVDVKGKPVLMFGAGGAAKAIAYALAASGAGRIAITGRNLAKVDEVAGPMGAVPMTLASLPCAAIDAALVVNAMSVSSPEEAPELEGLLGRLTLSNCELVFDINYGREKNIWRNLAMGNFVPFEDGIFMLAHQARRSFELWTGISVDVREFVSALRD